MRPSRWITGTWSGWPTSPSPRCGSGSAVNSSVTAGRQDDLASAHRMLLFRVGDRLPTGRCEGTTTLHAARALAETRDRPVEAA
jgi:hypothetical protein